MHESTRTQRIGAYAVIVRDGALLLTRVSARGFPAGWWALPGGGVDHGESPADTVVREVYEETGLAVVSMRLVDVHDVHTESPGRGDRWENYHGIHLLYAVDVEAGVEPEVVEVDGTTDLVQWIPLDQVGEIEALLPVVRHVLDRWDAFSDAS